MTSTKEYWFDFFKKNHASLTIIIIIVFYSWCVSLSNFYFDTRQVDESVSPNNVMLFTIFQSSLIKKYKTCIKLHESNTRKLSWTVPFQCDVVLQGDKEELTTQSKQRINMLDGTSCHNLMISMQVTTLSIFITRQQCKKSVCILASLEHTTMANASRNIHKDFTANK